MPPILLIHKNDHVPNDPLLVLSQQTSNEKISAPPCRHDEPSHLKIRQPTSTNFRTITASVPRTKCTALHIRDDLSSPPSSHPSSIPTVSAREEADPHPSRSFLYQPRRRHHNWLYHGIAPSYWHILRMVFKDQAAKEAKKEKEWQKEGKWREEKS